MAKTIDPVCKMEVDTETAAAKAEYKGQTYYFCAPGCKRVFERDPEKYIGQSAEDQEHHHHKH
jgi:YHS domain-containing protein